MGALVPFLLLLLSGPTSLLLFLLSSSSSSSSPSPSSFFFSFSLLLFFFSPHLILFSLHPLSSSPSRAALCCSLPLATSPASSPVPPPLFRSSPPLQQLCQAAAPTYCSSQSLQICNLNSKLTALSNQDKDSQSTNQAKFTSITEPSSDLIPKPLLRRAQPTAQDVVAAAALKLQIHRQQGSIQPRAQLLLLLPSPTPSLFADPSPARPLPSIAPCPAQIGRARTAQPPYRDAMSSKLIYTQSAPPSPVTCRHSISDSGAASPPWIARPKLSASSTFLTGSPPLPIN